MGIRERLLSGIAQQLGEPQGWRGRIVGRGLNRGNRPLVAAAVLAADLRRGQSAADLGFGGGVGLRLLLDAVGEGGHIYGVDVSRTMLQEARRRYQSECSAARLTLHEASMLDLPLADQSLDAVITVNTIYFVEDLAGAFAEIVRALRPEGRVVVGIGDPDVMATMAFTGSGFRLRPVEDITRVLAEAGLSGVRHERVGEGSRAAHLLIGSAAGART